MYVRRVPASKSVKQFKQDALVVKGQGHYFRKMTKVYQIVLTNVEKSWIITPFSDCRLVDPFQRYLRSKSTVVRNLVHC